VMIAKLWPTVGVKPLVLTASWPLKVAIPVTDRVSECTGAVHVDGQGATAPLAACTVDGCGLTGLELECSVVDQRSADRCSGGRRLRDDRPVVGKRAMRDDHARTGLQEQGLAGGDVPRQVAARGGEAEAGRTGAGEVEVAPLMAMGVPEVVPASWLKVPWAPREPP
jgi:hypothetical protein